MKPLPLLLAALLAIPAPAATVVNAIAAKVNGKVITKKEIAIQLQRELAFLDVPRAMKEGVPLSRKAVDAHMKAAEKQALDDLIDQKIILSELEARGAAIPDHVIEEDIRKFIREHYEGDEAAFRAELKKAGITWAKYRQNRKEATLVQAFRRQNTGPVAPPTERELRDELGRLSHLETFRQWKKDKVALQQIYLAAFKPELFPQARLGEQPTPEDLKEAAKSQEKLAKEIHRKLLGGADFAALAKEHSDDGRAKDGGDVPLSPRGEFNEAFARLYFSSPPGKLHLQPDQLVNPETKEVITRGFLIYRVTQIELGPPVLLEKVRARLAARLLRKKERSQFEKWIAPRRKTAIIRKMK